MANPSKAKGSKFEVAVAEYLDAQLPVKVERRALSGSRDTGDISGIPEVCIEVKNHRAIDLGSWLTEVEREADRDGGSLPVVFHKRRGKSDPAHNFVTMPGWTFVELLKAWLGDGRKLDEIRDIAAAPHRFDYEALDKIRVIVG